MTGGNNSQLATAQIERTERSGGDGGFSGGGGSNLSGAGAATRQPDPIYGDEEPF